MGKFYSYKILELSIIVLNEKLSVGRLLEGAVREDVPDGNNDVPEVLVLSKPVLPTS